MEGTHVTFGGGMFTHLYVLAVGGNLTKDVRTVVLSITVEPGTWLLIGTITASPNGAGTPAGAALDVAILPHGGAVTDAVGSATINTPSGQANMPETVWGIVTVTVATQYDMEAYPHGNSPANDVDWTTTAHSGGAGYSNATQLGAVAAR